uniref:Probable potassium transport system protein Kup n=1 Tax=uncultured Nitrospirae bacterium MY3-5B TaxID=798578 RepID=D9MP29_9BACT|nr:potassium uptake protein Kup [uncultured Nitrospirae bacterium MY3-5B]
MLIKEQPIKGIVKSLGLVFGDIGTSPIYTLGVIFLLLKPTQENIMGVLSLIVWTLTLLVSVEYAWLAMSLSKKGEGGTIVLKEILIPLLKSSRKVSFVTFLSYVGISLLIGDGVITPAISILSAVEGLVLVPAFKGTATEVLVVIAAFIAIVLFAVQKKGTEKVAQAFGPLMLLWFLVLTVSGIASMSKDVFVVKALNPYYAVEFLSGNGVAGFIVLSEVILCATGGEALYADMGHLGRRPIIRAWYFVYAALLINYLGQGAFILRHPEAKNILFEMVYHQAPLLYIPFLLLSITATVIASQAMISGIFSIVYQGIMTNVMPIFEVDYTSEEFRSQIYIGAVNWFLLGSVLFIIFLFRKSSNLAAAYGLAVTGTMSMTGIMMSWIFYLRKNIFYGIAALVVTVADLAFLLSNTYKITHGGYWSIVIATVPFLLIVLYTSGQRKLYNSLKPMPIDIFLDKFARAYATMSRIKGTALFFAKYSDNINPYVIKTMFINDILYEDNIIVNIIRRDDPFGATGYIKTTLTEGLRVFEIQVGYMEVVDVEEILRENGIDEKAVFYGIEDIATRNVVWQMFSIIKKLTPRFVQFFKIPSEKLHGIINRVEM